MVHFRKRLGSDILAKITEWLMEADTAETEHKKSGDDGDGSGDIGGNGPAELIKK